MNQFAQHTGIVLPLNISNVDTDNIIPKQFLKETTRIDFGKYLFFNWRYLENTQYVPNKNFILNQSYYKKSSILLTQKNFGCGSSREHAVWAIIDYGFRVIVAPSFADIFYKNSFNNRLLLITLPESTIHFLFQEIQSHKIKTYFTVNLHQQIIYTQTNKYSFQIDNSYKNYILNDIDNISVTLKYNSSIKKYESKQPQYLK